MKIHNFEKNRECHGLDYGLEIKAHQPNRTGLHGGYQIAKGRVDNCSLNLPVDLDTTSKLNRSYALASLSVNTSI